MEAAARSIFDFEQVGVGIVGQHRGDRLGDGDRITALLDAEQVAALVGCERHAALPRARCQWCRQ